MLNDVNNTNWISLGSIGYWLLSTYCRPYRALLTQALSLTFSLSLSFFFSVSVYLFSVSLFSLTVFISFLCLSFFSSSLSLCLSFSLFIFLSFHLSLFLSSLCISFCSLSVSLSLCHSFSRSIFLSISPLNLCLFLSSLCLSFYIFSGSLSLILFSLCPSFVCIFLRVFVSSPFCLSFFGSLSLCLSLLFLSVDGVQKRTTDTFYSFNAPPHIVPWTTN